MGSVGTVQLCGEWYVRFVAEANADRMAPFHVGGQYGIQVDIAPIDDDQKKPEHHDALKCTAVGTWPVTQKLMTAFEHLSNGLLPDGREVEPAWNEFQAQLLKEPFKPGLVRMRSVWNLYPEHVRIFIQDAREALRDAALNIVGLLRWRMDARGGHDPIREDRGLSACVDGQQLFRVHVGHAEFYGWSETHAVVTPEIHDEISRQAVGGMSQPVGHELLREAFTSKTHNPRSALVLAVAALEIGTKEFIAALVPDADWLVFNLPSPPVEKLLANYLPTVAALQPMFKPPPKEVLDTIKTAVQLRNLVSHKGDLSVTAAKLDEIMRTIADVLRMLDYFRGHAWALAYVTGAVNKAWLG